jgi:hypothetical protein
MPRARPPEYHPAGIVKEAAALLVLVLSTGVAPPVGAQAGGEVQPPPAGPNLGAPVEAAPPPEVAPAPVAAPEVPARAPAPPPPAAVPAPAATPPALAAEAPPPSPAPPARAPDEPNADRVVLAPTAYTHPEGTFFVTSYDVVVLQAGYAFTDRTQISVTATPPIGEPGEVKLALLDATLKSALARAGLVRVAALGSVSGVATTEPGLLLIGRAGAVAQLCLRATCASSLSISSNVVFAGPVLLMANGAGAILRAGRYVSFVAELDTLIPLGSEGGNANGTLAGGGVRLHFKHVAFDLSLLVGVGATDGGLPLLAITYRTGAR